MNTEFFKSMQTLLKEAKEKRVNRINNLGDDLDDPPLLSPYNNFFNFLADRDPTIDEPDVYHDIDGLILFWLNKTIGELSVSTDNLDPTLAWTKIVTAKNINSILYKAQGSATLSLGSATVSCPSFASGDQIQLNCKSHGGTGGAIFVSSTTPGTGFTIGSTSLLDASTIGWNVLN